MITVTVAYHTTHTALIRMWLFTLKHWKQLHAVYCSTTARHSIQGLLHSITSLYKIKTSYPFWIGKLFLCYFLQLFLCLLITCFIELPLKQLYKVKFNLYEICATLYDYDIYAWPTHMHAYMYLAQPVRCTTCMGLAREAIHGSLNHSPAPRAFESAEHLPLTMSKERVRM